MSKEKTIALIASDKVGKVMAGPGIRYSEMAKRFAKHFKTILFVPNDDCDIEIENVKISTYSIGKQSTITSQLKGIDYVIAQSLRPLVLKKIQDEKIIYIADLYDPLAIEVLEYNRFENDRVQKNTFNYEYDNLVMQIKSADHILCASDRQKDYYIGFISGQKIIDPKFYMKDSDVNSFLTVAPFGISSEDIDRSQNDISLFPEIKSTDKIVYWGGGIWNWFDPLLVVKAVENIAKKRDDVKLVFLGVKHPNPKIKIMKAAKDTLDYCEKKKLINKTVFFNLGWTPYDQRVNFLNRATVGTSTHFENLETRFSFRTRVLDYFWAEIPIVTTRGDSMADLVEKHQLGKVVNYQDEKELTAAIESIINDEKVAKNYGNNIAKMKSQFYWDNIVQKIIDKIEDNKISKKNSTFGQWFKLTFNFYKSGVLKKFFK